MWTYTEKFVKIPCQNICQNTLQVPNANAIMSYKTME